MVKLSFSLLVAVGAGYYSPSSAKLNVRCQLVRKSFKQIGPIAYYRSPLTHSHSTPMITVQDLIKDVEKIAAQTKALDDRLEKLGGKLGYL